MKSGGSKFNEKPGSQFGGNQHEANPKLTKATESAVELARENQRLQKELARVKMERDILKKAAYFAKEST